MYFFGRLARPKGVSKKLPIVDDDCGASSQYTDTDDIKVRKMDKVIQRFFIPCLPYYGEEGVLRHTPAMVHLS